MRLRKLAHGQTLMFLAPPEVNQNIVKFTGKAQRDIDGYDVVAWSLEQSCLSIERFQPLRILQGLSHHQRQKTMDRFLSVHGDLEKLVNEPPSGILHSALITAFREKEEQRLADLYAPQLLKTNGNPRIIEDSQKSSGAVVQKLLEMWKGLNTSASEEASMHEEHEREVAHEVEEETQLQRPPFTKALERAVDPRLFLFVKTGSLENLAKFSLAYDQVVMSTSAKLQTGRHSWRHIRVTTDFVRTVEPHESGHVDNYLRPTNWILTSKLEIRPSGLLIISQFEANELLRQIQDPSSGVTLHMYEPRVTKWMKSVDSSIEPVTASTEEWQALSRNLRRELNLFAGQLYFNTLKDYQILCIELGPRLNPSVDETLSFIKAWIAIRRKGQNFLQTHIGQMVYGRSIKDEAFV